jgi:hypothetical protein
LLLFDAQHHSVIASQIIQATAMREKKSRPSLDGQIIGHKELLFPVACHLTTITL